MREKQPYTIQARQPSNLKKKKLNSDWFIGLFTFAVID